MENSKIQWTDHTFNPWIGCSKVSPGCLHCYAENRDQRFAGGIHWGKNAPRQRTRAPNWREPEKWNKASAETLGRYHDGYTGGPPPRRTRVFCASLSDWLDDEVPIEWFTDLMELVHRCQHLDWQMLTKRPENWRPRLEAACEVLAGTALESESHWLSQWLEGHAPENMWIGTSIEDQPRALDRLHWVLSIPAKVRFISAEPLLGPVVLTPGTFDPPGSGFALTDGFGRVDGGPIGIHQVIVGGESGPGCRLMEIEWANSLLIQCRAAGAAFFMKQLGGYPDKRGELADFPEDLRVREFPSTN